MIALSFDAERRDDAARRRRLYSGDILVYSPSPAGLALIQHAREMIEAACAPHDPKRLHEHLSVEACVALLSKLKPAFIHHPRSKTLVIALLKEFGCDAAATYFDVPRLRSAMPQHYLATGIAYAFHPHRDTWYSAPSCQLNWWLPIYELDPENCLAFHPRYWTVPVRNGSADYDYERWNRESRFTAAQHVKSDTRRQPKPEEPIDDAGDVRITCAPGGVILFSGAQLHSTVPNRTRAVRWSIDFRTAHRADAETTTGAANIDSASSGTSIGDFLRVADLTPLPPEILDRHARAAQRLRSTGS